MKKDTKKNYGNVGIENALSYDLDYPTEKEMRREQYSKKKRNK